MYWHNTEILRHMFVLYWLFPSVIFDVQYISHTVFYIEGAGQMSGTILVPLPGTGLRWEEKM